MLYRTGVVSCCTDDHGCQRLRVNADVDGDRRRPILCDRSPAALSSDVAWLPDRHRCRVDGLDHRDAAAGTPSEPRRRRAERHRGTHLHGRLATPGRQTPLHRRQVGRNALSFTDENRTDLEPDANIQVDFRFRALSELSSNPMSIMSMILSTHKYSAFDNEISCINETNTFYENEAYLFGVEHQWERETTTTSGQNTARA